MTQHIFKLFLSDVLGRETEQPTRDQLDMIASSLLVPEEYKLLRQQPCAECGRRNLRVRRQSTLSPHKHPEPASWPYDCPAGDKLEVECTACGAESELVFWFLQ